MKVLNVQSSGVDSSFVKNRYVNTTTANQQISNVDVSNMPYGYNVSFNGVFSGILGRGTKSLSVGSRKKLQEIESNLTPYAKELIQDSKKIAQQYGFAEITAPVVLLAGLTSIKSYLDRLNSGECSYVDESSFTMHRTLEHDLYNGVIVDKKQRDKIYAIINDEIGILTQKFDAEKAPKTVSKSNVTFAPDLLNNIYSTYTVADKDTDVGGDLMVHDDTIFEAAYYPVDDAVTRKITAPFRMRLKDKIYIDQRPSSERVHLSFYDDKAKHIWQNLAVGTNMVILNDQDTTPSYLVNSFLNVFENSNGFGKLNKENTVIVNMNDIGELDNGYLSKKFPLFGKDASKNYVVIMNIMDKDTKDLAIDEVNQDIFNNAPSNVKFVMVAEKDKYYGGYNDAGLCGFFDTFGEITIPLMNAQQAKAMFEEQPMLTSKIKKHFTKEAVEKCVDASQQLKGNYPEKAQKVMERVASCYIDKEQISLADVEEYIGNAKEIFKPVENDSSSVKTILDTNIKIKDLVGSPSTKKEAMAIASGIEDKSIGTKGYIIYSQDGSIGAGRKYTAKAIAGETKSPYIEINAGDFGTKDVDLFGGGSLSPEASMKKLFSVIKAQAETNPTKSAILFIEAFEYFSCGEMISEYHQKAMSQMIREMNNAQEQGLNIVVIGSMDDPRFIDSATTKSFKFIDKIEVDSPGYDADARQEIIEYYIPKKNIQLAGDAKEQAAIKSHINRLMERASYIEIMTLLDKAKYVAKERKHNEITKGDFTEAYLQLEFGRPSSVNYPQYSKEMVSSHECGHALNATIMEEICEKHGMPSHLGPKVNFITLDPRGSFGGCVFTSDADNPEMSFENVFSNIICDFGGNSCERQFYNQDGSWGITADMRNATYMATLATAVMGQGRNFGKKSLEGMQFISEKDKETMNKDIDVILRNAQAISEAIVYVYKDFIQEFTNKYSGLVGTGECIIHREEFTDMLQQWREKQSPEKIKEIEGLEGDILKVIKATKRGTVCYREQA